MAAERAVGVERERDVAVRTATRDAAGPAVQGGRHAAPVEEQDRPPTVLDEPAERLEERRRQRIAGLPPEVDEPHARHRRSDPRAERASRKARPALGPRGRRAVHRHRTLERGAFRGHGARVVPRVGLLLVRSVVLLVHDDQPHASHRCEHGGPRADDDPRLPARDPVALVASLGVAERRMDDRDEVAEAAPEAADGLRRKRDLRDEDDRSQAALEGCGTRLEVHLGLPAARRPVEQDVLTDPLVERRDDPRDRVPLVVREPLRLGLALERLAQGRRGPFTTRRAARGRDELERAGRRRPVVVGEPQGEVDELRGDLVEQAADGRKLDPGRRADPDVRDHPSRRAAPEADGDDRAFRRPLRHLVRERAGERSGRDERIDGREGHVSRVLASRDDPPALPG